jgi:hypothetical protein
MNNIITVKIERTNNISGDMVYRLIIEHLDDDLLSIFTELDFSDVYKSFEYLNNLENTL